MARSFSTPSRSSQDNIYAALRAIDLENLGENTYEYGVQSTPMKQGTSLLIPHASPSIPYASPSNPYASPSIPYASPRNLYTSPSIPFSSPPNLYASPSIPYASPLWNRSLQTPTHDRSTSGIV